ncbi:MAG: putative endonuclease [Actinomycetota bacterium]|nr:putative endonuclease [Actinomycetota bacterium]
MGVGATEAVGRYGEDLAVRYLEQRAFTVLARRWRCRRGEIDIVAVDDGCLVVVEVKTRRSLTAGTPEEAVTPAKIARLRLLTGLWLGQQQGSWPAVRIDVVTVLLPRSGAARITHLQGVE